VIDLPREPRLAQGVDVFAACAAKNQQRCCGQFFGKKPA